VRTGSAAGSDAVPPDGDGPHGEKPEQEPR
jgi:hypothetical protein